MALLSQLVPEQRSVFVAEQKLDRAEAAFVASIVPGQGCKSWSARVKYYQATTDLHSAIARLHKAKCALANRRHLRVVVR